VLAFPVPVDEQGPRHSLDYDWLKFDLQTAFVPNAMIVAALANESFRAKRHFSIIPQSVRENQNQVRNASLLLRITQRDLKRQEIALFAQAVE